MGAGAVVAVSKTYTSVSFFSQIIVKLRRGSGKDWQGMAPKVKGLKA